jgi:hypothetical protein
VRVVISIFWIFCICLPAKQLLGQHLLENIQPFTHIYDTAETMKLPPVALLSVKYQNAYDSVFAGIFNLGSGKQLLQTRYPDTSTALLNYMPIKGGTGFYISNLVVNAYRPSSLSYLSVIYITDSLLRVTDSIKFNYHYKYLYHHDSLNGNISIDPHDVQVVQHQGKQYAFLIGFRYETSDQMALMHSDSVIMRYTSIHVIDVKAHKEVARFEPEKQGLPIAPFYDKRNLSPGARPFRYSHPHINILEAHATPSGWNIFFSARDPGLIARLDWNGSSDKMNLRWLMGNRPKYPVAGYIPTVTDNALSNCHGASALYKGDTVYIATYNNADPAFNWPQQKSSRFQVYRVLHGIATIVWQSPDIHFMCTGRGQAIWHSDDLLCIEGQNGGIVSGRVPDSLKYTYSQHYERLQVWKPFANKLICGINLPGDAGYVNWVDSLPNLHPAILTIRDSAIILTYPDTAFRYWTINQIKHSERQLNLPHNYMDSLNLVSAWIQTGLTGVWQVSQKEITKLLPAVVKKSRIHNLPQPYSWKIYDLKGVEMDAEQINNNDYYIFEALLNGSVVYHQKHLVKAY